MEPDGIAGEFGEASDDYPPRPGLRAREKQRCRKNAGRGPKDNRYPWNDSQTLAKAARQHIGNIKHHKMQRARPCLPHTVSPTFSALTHVCISHCK